MVIAIFLFYHKSCNIIYKGISISLIKGSIFTKFEIFTGGHRTGKGQFSFQSQRILFNAKECSNYCTIALILHASKVMLKILQGRLQQYVN